jgi:mannosyltransferase OCH1-like enzyme
MYIGVLIGFLLIYLHFQGMEEGFQAGELHDIPFFIEHTARNEQREVSNVPLVIYQSWHTNKVPTKMKESIHTLINMNQECDYYLYSDDASLKYLTQDYDEEVVSAFNTLKPGAYKSDLWRYCILYKRGGIYLDIKLQSVKPLLPIIEANPTIYVRDWPGSCTEEIGIYNAFMVSPPNNPIFKHCIDDIVNSCKLKLYKNGVLDITGPCLLGQMIKQHISLDHIHTLPFKMIWFRNPPTNDVEIQYNGDVIIKSYKEYRAEQKSFQKTTHYSQMWMNREVYA